MAVATGETTLDRIEELLGDHADSLLHTAARRSTARCCTCRDPTSSTASSATDRNTTLRILQRSSTTAGSAAPAT